MTFFKAENISIDFGGIRAVNDVSFEVDKGMIFTIVGPNGAGKSTTMRILAGALGATGGKASIGGVDVFDSPLQVKRMVGYLPEVPPLYPEMTVTGYPLEDLVHKPGFVIRSREAVERVAEASGSCTLVVGFADVGPDGPDGPAHNAVAVCHGGRIVGTYHKECLPTYDVFDEARDFAPGTAPLVLHRIGGVRVGLAICEDLWVAGGPVERLVAGGADLIATVNGSPYHPGKQAARESVVAASAAASAMDLPCLRISRANSTIKIAFLLARAMTRISPIWA